MRYRLVTIILALVIAAPLPWLARPAAAAQCFPETGFCVADRFLDYWLAHGGLAINGYPIAGERQETLEDGKPYLVQWFERVRLEYHPEIADPRYQILLGQFGRRLRPADPPVEALPGATFFAATGHNVGARFGAYWQANGGLAQFGYPLSEEFWEILDDGGRYRVQYFERARFEYHPENVPPYDVLLGQFGRRILNWGGSLTYTYDLGTFYQGEEQNEYRTSYDPATGEYTVALLALKTGWNFWSRVRTFADATIDVDVRRAAGGSSTSYGLALRVQPRGANDLYNAHYDVTISPGGSFAVFYNGTQDGQVATLQNWTDSTAIRLGNATNHLTVTLKGSTMTVAINGQVVGTYNDIATAGGWVGVDTDTYNNLITAVYSNLRVTYDVGPASQAPALTPVGGVR